MSTDVLVVFRILDQAVTGEQEEFAKRALQQIIGDKDTRTYRFYFPKNITTAEMFADWFDRTVGCEGSGNIVAIEVENFPKEFLKIVENSNFVKDGKILRPRREGPFPFYRYVDYRCQRVFKVMEHWKDTLNDQAYKAREMAFRRITGNNDTVMESLYLELSDFKKSLEFVSWFNQFIYPDIDVVSIEIESLPEEYLAAVLYFSDFAKRGGKIVLPVFDDQGVFLRYKVAKPVQNLIE